MLLEYYVMLLFCKYYWKRYWHQLKETLLELSLTGKKRSFKYHMLKGKENEMGLFKMLTSDYWEKERFFEWWSNAHQPTLKYLTWFLLYKWFTQHTNNEGQKILPYSAIF